MSSTVSALAETSTTCEACGWAAAGISMIAFGSFGVPIKSEAARSVDIDPLVFQSYKTLMCFLTCWIVLLLPGQQVEFTFTPWGIVSGLFWVPAGVATVYAVKAAGLAIGIAVGSSFIVLVSFTWGIFIFQEHVKSVGMACLAILFMIMGLWGMAFYSSPLTIVDKHAIDLSYNDAVGDIQLPHHLSPSTPEYRKIDIEFSTSGLTSDHEDSSTSDTVVLFGKSLSKRTVGIAAAALCGIWGGSIMVPMHYAPKNTSGMSYVISFGIGAAIITVSLWVLRYMYYVVRAKSWRMAYYSLPSFHLRVMWLAGGTSGTLWSIGNFFSLIAVENLGEGVGYSVVQAGMLVSGLWGIFYFNEIVGVRRIFPWMMFALLTVSGIILLSQQHYD